jgi:hypothetical protein
MPLDKQFPNAKFPPLSRQEMRDLIEGKTWGATIGGHLRSLASFG